MRLKVHKTVILGYKVLFSGVNDLLSRWLFYLIGKELLVQCWKK